MPKLALVVIFVSITLFVEPRNVRAGDFLDQPSEKIYELRDRAEAVGFSLLSRTWSALIHDIDGNDFDDVLLVRHEPRPERIFFNKGGVIEPTDFAIPADRHHCDAADVNLDGRLDIYCSVGAGKGLGQGKNNLFIQHSNGSFLDEASEFGVTDPFGRGRYVAFINANGDKYPDLFVGNKPQRNDSISSSNKLFINTEGKRFVDGSSFGLNTEIGAKCVEILDFDSDGRDDLLVCGKQKLHLFLNKNYEGFTDFSMESGLERRAQKAITADLNGDQRPDLVYLTTTKLVVRLHNGRKWGKPVRVDALNGGQSVTAGDADGDGDLDLYVIEVGCSGEQTGATESREAREDFLLVNDGSGMFTRLSAGHTRREQGCGSQVYAIDVDRNGKDGFLILNGRNKSQGRLQFIELHW